MLIKYFSDRVLDDPMVGRKTKNIQLSNWALEPNFTERYAGLVAQRTMWLIQVAGGPYTFVPTHKGGANNLDLTNAHRCLRISDEEFDRVAAILHDALVHLSTPAGVHTPAHLPNLTAADIQTVLGAFAAHKDEVIRGHKEHLRGVPDECPRTESRAKMMAVSSGKKGYGYASDYDAPLDTSGGAMSAQRHPDDVKERKRARDKMATFGDLVNRYIAQKKALDQKRDRHDTPLDHIRTPQEILETARTRGVLWRIVEAARARGDTTVQIPDTNTGIVRTTDIRSAQNQLKNMDLKFDVDRERERDIVEGQDLVHLAGAARTNATRTLADTTLSQYIRLLNPHFHEELQIIARDGIDAYLENITPEERAISTTAHGVLGMDLQSV